MYQDKYYKYKKKYLDLKAEKNISTANTNIIQHGGGLNYNIHLGPGICINLDQLDPKQKTIYDKIKKLEEKIDMNYDPDYIISDQMSKPNWILLYTTDSEIERAWDRFPYGISQKPAKNFYWYHNMDCGTICIRVDSEGDDVDKPILDKKIVNDFLNKINKLDKTKSPADELYQLYKELLYESTAIMTGKWLAMWTD